MYSHHAGFTHPPQRVGLTTELPNVVPADLCDSVGPHVWVYAGNSISHNKQSTAFRDLPSLEDPTPGQSVGLLVTPNGQLHLFLDGECRRKIATGLPVDTPLLGAACVYGRCAKVKSEIMSGESSGVVIPP